MGVPPSYNSLIVEFAREAERTFVKQVEARQIKRRRDDLLPPITEIANANSMPSGEEVFKRYIWLVKEGLYFRLHIFQLRFFNLIVCVLAEFLFGADWHTKSVYYMKLYGWKVMSRVCFAVAARRFGKTVVAGQAQAALALATPSKIVTLSTGKRASDGMRSVVLRCIEQTTFKENIGNRLMSEEIFVRPIGYPNDMSSLRFLPASPRITVLYECAVSAPYVILFVCFVAGSLSFHRSVPIPAPLVGVPFSGTYKCHGNDLFTPA